MLSTRYEEYKNSSNSLPFIFHHSLKRTRFQCSESQNWHEDIEIQLCLDGEGWVLLDGKRFDFSKGDVISVGSNVIHYTGTDSQLVYSCIIINTEFCKRVGLDTRSLKLTSHFKSCTIEQFFADLTNAYLHQADPLRSLKLNRILLNILIELTEKHSVEQLEASQISRFFDNIKLAIKYLRENYSEKVTLDQLSKAVLLDKYTLCREFKKITGQTVIENLNRYRCMIASESLASGKTVAEAAELSGFDNLSFFTKTFKKYQGRLPSSFKR